MDMASQLTSLMHSAISQNLPTQETHLSNAFNLPRRKAWGLVVWPYALSLLALSLLASSFWGGYSETTLSLLYAGMTACMIALGTHLVTFGWLVPSDPQFRALCQEIHVPLPLSHEEYWCVVSAGMHDPQMSRHLAYLQSEGRMWDTALVDLCRDINSRR